MTVTCRSSGNHHGANGTRWRTQRSRTQDLHRRASMGLWAAHPRIVGRCLKASPETPKRAMPEPAKPVSVDSRRRAFRHRLWQNCLYGRKCHSSSARPIEGAEARLADPSLIHRQHRRSAIAGPTQSSVNHWTLQFICPRSNRSAEPLPAKQATDAITKGANARFKAALRASACSHAPHLRCIIATESSERRARTRAG